MLIKEAFNEIMYPHTGKYNHYELYHNALNAAKSKVRKSNRNASEMYKKHNQYKEFITVCNI